MATWGCFLYVFTAPYPSEVFLWRWHWIIWFKIWSCWRDLWRWGAKEGFQERRLHGYSWMLVFVTYNIVSLFTWSNANRSRTVLEQVNDEFNVLVHLWKFPVCFLIWTSLHRVFILKTTMLQLVPSLQLIPLVNSLGAFAGCLWRREVTVAWLLVSR